MPSDIYVGGVSGARPEVLVGYQQQHKRAQHILFEKAFAYLDDEASREFNIGKNRVILIRWKIVPRVVRDVSTVDTWISLIGHHYPASFLLAPIGLLGLLLKKLSKN